MRSMFVLGLLVCTLSGCTGTYFHIAGNRVATGTPEPRSVTEAAYLWGIIQPNDIVPTNCPEHVPLADVTAETNAGYVLLSAITLGIVVIQKIEWHCAKLPSGQGSNVLSDNDPPPNPSK